MKFERGFVTKGEKQFHALLDHNGNVTYNHSGVDFKATPEVEETFTVAEHDSDLIKVTQELAQEFDIQEVADGETYSDFVAEVWDSLVWGERSQLVDA